MLGCASDSSSELTVDVKTFDSSMLSRANGLSRLGQGSVGQDVWPGKVNADQCTRTCIWQHHLLEAQCAGPIK